MKKISLFLLIIMLGYASCNDDDVDLCLRGDGTVNEYIQSVSAFDEVELSGPINLNITQGGVQSVVIRAEKQLYDPLIVEVDNGTLEVRYPRNVTCFETNVGVWIDITVPDLEKVAISGQSDIISSGDINLDNLTLDISGEAYISLTGEVNELAFNASGKLEVDNFDLDNNIQYIVVSGEADMDIRCEIELTLVISGAATIRYKGNPQISQNTSGSLNLIDAN
ncbi:head GIN domain-containing protein [Fulvivirga sedimenti]|uniref:DUF2807 domain-containing protein n=1 Tax=Fulvivirga sedimenti TaxID=2879465 RepID=A0A9X1HSK3_9BACT|nr:head GIN domain-containing protein [Fulvivirga sedimenti]MCA6075629.1 DUF2807 domain-containing protein [Fulvivirga sedimenti]